MLNKRSFVFFALCCLTAAAASAQEALRNLDIEISVADPAQCDAVKSISAVIRGDDRGVYGQTQGQGCQWHLNTGSAQIPWFRSRVSLRLNGPMGPRRTKCRVAAWDDVKGMFVVKFPVLPAQQITITPDPVMDLRYVREVRPQDRKNDVPCSETGVLGTGITDVWTMTAFALREERLRLLYFETKDDTCGLEVNAVPRIDDMNRRKSGKIPLSR